jgi:environmental stress-induced protein Ves
LRILRATRYLSMPWKNGGGVTTEIAVSPAGAGLDDFDWRVSMARVESGGPFSMFAGIDRTLAVLEGEGIVLSFAGASPAEITRASTPHSFPADVPTQAALIAGPITDLNVMTRRGRMIHAVERIAISAPIEIHAAAGTTLILSLDGDLSVAGAATVCVGPLDTLSIGSGEPKLRLEPARTATLFLIRIDHIAGND